MATPFALVMLVLAVICQPIIGKPSESSDGQTQEDIRRAEGRARVEYVESIWARSDEDKLLTINNYLDALAPDVSIAVEDLLSTLYDRSTLTVEAAFMRAIELIPPVQQFLEHYNFGEEDRALVSYLGDLANRLTEVVNDIDDSGEDPLADTTVQGLLSEIQQILSQLINNELLLTNGAFQFRLVIEILVQLIDNLLKIGSTE